MSDSRIDFGVFLEEIHGNQYLSDDEVASIKINHQRLFEVPENYNLTLGYAGDVNSQIVNFELSTYQEGHNLADCQYKILKWKNIKSGAEGQSELLLLEDVYDTLKLSWEVPPEAMAASGPLHVGISIQDTGSDGTGSGGAAFIWNTSVFKDFVIGESFDEVKDPSNDMPPKNEILNVNVESRTIVAPVGYNNIVASFGDINTSEVHFLIDGSVRGIEVDGHVSIDYAFEGVVGNSTDIQVRKLYTTLPESDTVLVTWTVPEEITNNSLYYTGNFAISLRIHQEAEGDTPEKRWATATFAKLAIGESLPLADINNANEKFVANVEQIIDNYFAENEFIVKEN